MTEEPVVPKGFWVVNPDGRVVEVPDDTVEAQMARGAINGWKPASKDQITSAEKVNEIENEKARARQSKIQSSKAVAQAAVVAAHVLAQADGEPSGSPDPGPVKKGGKKGVKETA